MIDIVTFSLVADAVDLGSRVATLWAEYNKKAAEKEIQQLITRWRSGQDKINKSRSELAKCLHGFYGSTAVSSDFRSVCYTPPQGPRLLPLITQEKFLTSKFSPKAKFVGTPTPGRKIEGSEFIKQMSLWSLLNLRLWDAPLYSLQQATEGNVAFRLARFFTYRPSFGALPEELVLAFADHSIQEIASNPDHYLPLRMSILPDVSALTDFDARLVAGGPAVLFVVRTSDKDAALLLQRRSYRVSDEPGALTVVPKAFHQPTVDRNFEVDPLKTVFRECYEELFGGEERTQHIDPEFYLKKCDAVRELADANVATIQSTGMVWDLTRGNYHPLYCCYVRKASWWERHRSSIRLSWEVDPEVEPLVRLSDNQMLAHVLQREDWAPESYVAMVEGLRWLTKSTDIGQDFPPIDGLLPELCLESIKSLTGNGW